MTDLTEPCRELVTVDDLAALIREQRAELGELRAEVAELRQHNMARPQVEVDVEADHDDGAGRTSRRSLLRGAGLASAVGVIAGAGIDSGHVAAADGNALLIGRPNTSSNSTTLSPNEATTNLPANVFTATTGSPAVGSGFPAALGGYGYGHREIHNGVYAFTSSRDDARANTGHALVAYADGGSRSNILFRTTFAAAPTDDIVVHQRGEMRAQTNGDLWWCAETGTPGTWKKITGPAVRTNEELSADVATINAQLGAVAAKVDTYSVAANVTLELVTPFRAYDSRFSMAPTESGPLPIGASRVIPIRDARDVETGAVVTANAVPAGATGLVYTISTVAPAGTGFLTVVPKEATAITAATINFDATSPTVLNNTSTVKLGGDREIRVIAGGVLGGNCNFVLDVVGYYRAVNDVVA